MIFQNKNNKYNSNNNNNKLYNKFHSKINYQQHNHKYNNNPNKMNLNVIMMKNIVKNQKTWIIQKQIKILNKCQLILIHIHMILIKIKKNL